MDIEGLFMTMENSDYTIRMDQSIKLGNSSYDALMTSDHGMILFFFFMIIVFLSLYTWSLNKIAIKKNNNAPYLNC